MLRKYIIEREIPGVGAKSPTDFCAIAGQSNRVLGELGPDIQWVESFVADNKTYCVYLARDEDIIREHARRGGFPANVVSQVTSIIDPTTSE